MVLCCCKRPSQTTSSEPAGVGGVYKSPPIPLHSALALACVALPFACFPSSCSHTFEILPARFSDRGISALWWWILEGEDDSSAAYFFLKL